MSGTPPMRLLVLGLVSLSAITLAQPAAEPPRVTPGLDRVRELEGEPLRGKRIGVITNHTGRAIDGTPVVALLNEELGLRCRFVPPTSFRASQGRYFLERSQVYSA